MSSIRLYNEVTRAWLGTTHVHHIPRIGEIVIFNDNFYRVFDVAHPTENERGRGIHVPMVKVGVSDPGVWLDDWVRQP